MLKVPSIHPLCIDVTKTEDVRKAIEGLGDVHFLVNNAGISKLDSFLDVKPEDFDK
jgi:L-xylulose reductase